ncbi:MAG: hypothetical protein WCL61_03705 [bacterium]
MPHISGKKVARSHSSVIEEAMPIIRHALKLPNISKVVNSQIAVIEKGPPRIKIKPVLAGLELMVRGKFCRQKFFIYTADIESITIELERVWKKYYS